MYYLNYFFIFSIFGHLLETTMYKMFNWNLESGFLYGYWTPVYGLGAILILFLSNYIFKKLKLNKFLEIIIFLKHLGVVIKIDYIEIITIIAILDMVGLQRIIINLDKRIIY